jgi:hypothetical protein
MCSAMICIASSAEAPWVLANALKSGYPWLSEAMSVTSSG